MAKTPSPGARSAIVIAAIAFVLPGCATNRVLSARSQARDAKVRIAVNEETNEVDQRGCAPAQS
jgi:hypothetical protein